MGEILGHFGRDLGHFGRDLGAIWQGFWERVLVDFNQLKEKQACIHAKAMAGGRVQIENGGCKKRVD